jgi:hypothetical protein
MLDGAGCYIVPSTIHDRYTSRLLRAGILLEVSMRRILLVLPALLVQALSACDDRVGLLEPGSVAPANASAGGPPVPVTFVDTAEAGVLCEFAIRIEASEKDKTIELPGERTLLIFPGALWTLTNLSNGVEEALRIPGSFHITTLANGDVETVFTGRNLLFDPVAGLVLTMGRFRFVADAGGNVVQPLTGTGRQVDVCALLR